MRIPYDFIRDKVRMSWRDVEFGLDNELIDASVPIAMAADRLEQSADNAELLVKLAGADDRWIAVDLVHKLVSAEGLVEPSLDKWLYLTLGWTWNGRKDLQDPLRRVEEIYSDFNYPARIAKFVRYMPMSADDRDLGSVRLNEGRLFDYWRAFLDEEAARFRVDLEN